MVDPAKSNPLRILRALDGFLKSPFELIVYGRSALALGYPQPPPQFSVTLDVDAILPSRDLKAIEANDDFWDALDKVNETLEDAGLYFTHLFEEHQVILTPQWLSNTVPMTAFEFARLRLMRPSTHDLILTKMMRVDPQDREDIQFLLRQADFSWAGFELCLQQARCPRVPEIQDAFKKNAEWIRRIKVP
jgi:hypothetical protein